MHEHIIKLNFIKDWVMYIAKGYEAMSTVESFTPCEIDGFNIPLSNFGNILLHLVQTTHLVF